MARGFPLAKMQAQKQAGVDASAELGTRAFVGSDCKGFQRRSIRPGAWKSRRSRGEVQTAALQYSVVVEMSGHSFDHRLVSSRHEGRRRANDSPEGRRRRRESYLSGGKGREGGSEEMSLMLMDGGNAAMVVVSKWGFHDKPHVGFSREWKDGGLGGGLGTGAGADGGSVRIYLATTSTASHSSAACRPRS
ncbi:hypothetical protein AXG93_4905s1330 [Marchantia polymorpha subsp. ruderalis]|uniref:Uncharacterized protein n=1 Tax=Marchantia polymorpha subsp. ruderalis TaxID=1480154 RepID=A0A176VJ40_MARPO|nr:hypothetical protein AXG93_4905s1330 [Marchantia polymorpha subsp. ruderalis]